MIMLHQIFEIISIFGIIFAMIILYVVASYKTSDHQKRMMLICSASLVINVGNFFSVFSTEFEALLRAHQLQAIGHICVITSFIIFMAGYCNIKLPRMYKVGIVGFNFVCGGGCLAGRTSYLFYKEIIYVSDVQHPYIDVVPGILYILVRLIDFAIILVLCGFIIKSHRESNEKNKRKNVYLFIGTVAATFGDLATSFELIPGYNFVSMGMTICFIFLGIAIYKYGILDTIQLAKESALEQITEGLIVVDADKKLVYANGKAREIMPYLDSGETEYSAQKIKEIFDNEHYMVQTKNEYYEAKISELYENGYIKGYMAWLFDLTFINSYTKEIVALKEAAEAANQSKSSFLANMSHEIRTPMNAIVGFNELILQKSTDKDITNFASDIKTASNNLLTIINDILDLSKIESGKMDVINTKYHMTELINDSVINIKEAAKHKGLEFILDVDKKLPYELYGDDKHIRNVLINLMNNAVKYTNQGFVKVIVSLDEMREDEAVIKFSVADSGIGIKKEDIPKLFNKFEKFDSKKNSGIEGTGLGLTIVKGYTEHMGGTITVDSEYGMGSTFTVTLTQKISDHSRIEDYENEEKDKLSDEHIQSEIGQLGHRKHFKAPNARILVTDDNAINLKVSASLLSSYGIRVDTAESGMRAIELCSTNPYDIIFMDHMMPEMDGVEAMKRIRTLLDDDTYKSCIIALTANAISGVKKMMEAEGFDGYITKPIDINYMEKMLLKHLPPELIVYVDEKVAESEKWQTEETEKYIERPQAKQSAEENSKNKETFEQCLEGFNIEQGIINCGGDRETYEEILQVYYESGEGRIEEFAGFLAKKDYKNYIIGVHGLKSSSASIGAMEVSECAKTHEFSGKDEKYEFLHEDFEHLVTLYRSALEKIGNALVCCGRISKSEEKYVISEETENRAVKAICKMIDSFDYDGVNRLISELASCQLSESVQKNIDSLRKAVDIEDAKEIFSIKDMLSI